MSIDGASYNIYTLAMHEATLDEEDSFRFLSNYFIDKKLNYTYTYPDISFDQMSILTSNFCLFYAKIKIVQNDVAMPTNIPINVFRYIMLEDGSWSHYYTVRRKKGYVVEGMYWSNGIVYQVRQDAENYEVYQIVLSIDPLTKTLYNFPEMKDI
jgi:hypothetical protein